MDETVRTKLFAKTYALYLFRWQLSSPVLLGVLCLTGATLAGTILANLIGGLLFFWIDRWILRRNAGN